MLLDVVAYVVALHAVAVAHGKKILILHACKVGDYEVAILIVPFLFFTNKPGASSEGEALHCLWDYWIKPRFLRAKARVLSFFIVEGLGMGISVRGEFKFW